MRKRRMNSSAPSVISLARSGPSTRQSSRRRFVALEAQALGRGGVSLMARISGLARATIYQDLSDIRNKVFTSGRRIRKEGGGRKKKAIQVMELSAGARAERLFPTNAGQIKRAMR
jgi:hypothetical protein